MKTLLRSIKKNYLKISHKHNFPMKWGCWKQKTFDEQLHSILLSIGFTMCNFVIIAKTFFKSKPHFAFT